MSSSHRPAPLWKRPIPIALATVALLLVGAGAWLAARATDLIWSMVDRDSAILLEGEEVPEKLSAAAWQDDLHHLARVLPERFVRFDQAVDRRTFEAEVAAARERLPALPREQRILELMGVTALPGTGTGHAGISPMQRTLDWRFLPIHAWWFDDGVWITVATDPELVGSEILAVGRLPADEILTRAEPYLPADNPSGRRALASGVFSFAEMLAALGATEDDGSVELTLRRPGEEPFTRRLEPVALASVGGLRWGGLLQKVVAEDVWSPADPRPRAADYSFEYRPESRLLLVRLHAMTNQPERESFAAFSERLGAVVEGHEIDRFVVDLRTNGGGNNQVARPLVDLLTGHPKIDRRGVLYVLIGPRTYSAAGNFATALERRTRALFAGEPTGSAPNHFGDSMSLLLPRSKVIYRVSTRYWEDGGSWDRRPWLAPSAPELHVPLAAADHFVDRDRVLEAVLAHEPEPHVVHPVEPAVAARLAGRYRFNPFQTVEIRSIPEGGLWMEILGVETFVETELRLEEGSEGAGDSTLRFATDVPELVLEWNRSTGALRLDGQGTELPMEPVPEEYRLPIELVRSEEPEERAEGIARFRHHAAAGEVPDSRTELELNRIGYALIEADEPQEAIELFRLQTELYPEVANAWDSLGDGYRVAGDVERAKEAYRTALEIDPWFVHSQWRLRVLESLEAE